MIKISLFGNRQLFTCFKTWNTITLASRSNFVTVIPQPQSLGVLGFVNRNSLVTLRKNCPLKSGTFSKRVLNQRNFSESKPTTEKKGSSKLRLLGISFGIGALLGLGYVYSNKTRKLIPVANVDSDNDLLFAEPPPIELIAKKVNFKI